MNLLFLPNQSNPLKKNDGYKYYTCKIMKKKKIRRIVLISTIALLIIVIIGKKAGIFGKSYTQKVSCEKVEKRTIVEYITANGRIQPETEVNIAADVSGEVVELHVEEGDEVKVGQLLAKIKPDTYLSALDRMSATLNSSKSNLANSKARLAQVKAQFSQAKLSYERNKSLYNKGAISKAEFETAEANYQVAKAEVEAAQETVNAAIYSVKSAEASLNEAKENLQKTTIYAPMAGTISKLNIEKGERVVGTMQMAGTEVLRVANLNKMEVLVEVNENDIVRITHGDTAIIEVDAYLEHEFKGIVTEIANSANVQGVGTDQITNFDVKIAILSESYQDLIPEDNPNYYPFRPGMSATVDIQTETEYDVLSIPIQSVTTRSDSSGIAKTNTDLEKNSENKNLKNDNNIKKSEEDKPKEVVFVYKDGIVEMKEVKTGIQDNMYIQITKGLELNEEVVSAPYSAISKQLKNKQKVEKVDKEKLFQNK